MPLLPKLSPTYNGGNLINKKAYFNTIFTNCIPQGNVSIPVVPDLELKKREYYDPPFKDLFHGAYAMAKVNRKFFSHFQCSDPREWVNHDSQL